MNKILITGGTGNIGSRLVADMISDGYHVQFTTRSETKAKNFIKKFNFPDELCNPIVLDFKDNNAFDKLEQQLTELPNTIIHNARSLDTLRIDNHGRISNSNFQDEFYNGEFSGSTLIISNGELNESCAEFKEIDPVGVSYGIRAYRSTNDDYFFSSFINPLNNPTDGFISTYFQDDTSPALPFPNPSS